MLTLTKEQQDIVHEAEYVMQQSLIGMGVPAFAGSGKTFTLLEIAKKLRHHRILYLAFNRAINEEMKAKVKKLGMRHMTCKTGHGLAYGPIVMSGRLDQKRLTPSIMKMVYDLQYDRSKSYIALVATYMDRKKQHDKERAASTVIIQTVNKFLQSASKSIGWRHVPYAAVLDQDEHERFDFSNAVATAAQQVWDELIIDEHGSFPITHDVYLKLFALGEPELGYDLILYDEAQDANPVILDLVKNQNSSVVMVGDTHQSIYQFRGAEDAMKEAPGQQLPLTQSWRFGPEIASWANTVLSMLGEERALIGSGPAGSVIDTPYDARDEEPENLFGAVLCRSNAGVVKEAIAALSAGIAKDKLAVVGGTKAAVIDLQGAYELYRGKQPKHEELGMLKNWDELIELSESNEGASYRPIVKMVEEYGDEIPSLCEQLDSLRTKDTDPNVQLVVSTAHKAKGREWEYVRLSDDFSELVKENKETGEVTPNKQEMNLVYVTVTRATKVLNLGGYGRVITAAADALESFLPGDFLDKAEDEEVAAENEVEVEDLPQNVQDAADEFDFKTAEAYGLVLQALKLIDESDPAWGSLKDAEIKLGERAGF